MSMQQPTTYIIAYCSLKIFTAWIPSKPNITNLGSGEYEAWFQLPTSDFIVDSYMFRIGEYKKDNSSHYQFVSILNEYKVDSNQVCFYTFVVFVF